MTDQKKPFSVPVVCNTNPNDWYIFFEYFYTGKWHKRKLREGINRIKDKKQRRKEADVLAEQRHEWLKEGWNPITDPEYKLRNIVSEGGLKTMLFIEALDFALSKKKLAKKSRQDYGNMLEYVKKSAKKYGYSLLPISKVTRVHILDLLQKMSDDYKWSNHRYNMYLGTVRTMFTTLEIWLAVEYNPAAKIEELKVAESNKFAAYTDEEKRPSRVICTKVIIAFLFICNFFIKPVFGQKKH